MAGKAIGALPALLVTTAAGALTIGVSILPRAEIAMVIMDLAHDMECLSRGRYAARGHAVITLGHLRWDSAGTRRLVTALAQLNPPLRLGLRSRQTGPPAFLAGRDIAILAKSRRLVP